MEHHDLRAHPLRRSRTFLASRPPGSLPRAGSGGDAERDSMDVSDSLAQESKVRRFPCASVFYRLFFCQRVAAYLQYASFPRLHSGCCDSLFVGWTCSYRADCEGNSWKPIPRWYAVLLYILIVPTIVSVVRGIQHTPPEIPPLLASLQKTGSKELGLSSVATINCAQLKAHLNTVAET